MSLVARVVRQFYEGTEAVTLKRVLTLPAQPTTGSRLDLRAQGVEAPRREGRSMGALESRELGAEEDFGHR